MSLLWGIDLGGSKIEVCALDPADLSNPLIRKRIPTEANKGYGHIVDAVGGLVRSAAKELGEPEPRQLGIGTPGAIEPATGLLKNSNTACLIGKPVREDLAKALQAEVRMSNDANCFALAEAHLGASRGYKTSFGVIMGTGVGGGMVVNGQVLHGANGIAGEWGHVVLDPYGPACYCGQRGCVETYLRGPSVEQRHEERTGEKLSLKEISERYDTDLQCRRTIAEMCTHFGRSLALVVNIFDPEIIVLGGGAGQVPHLYTYGVEHLQAHAFTKVFTTKVVAPELGDSAGVFGAAMLWARSEEAEN
ncbi:MAG: ROK family protein [Fimbriimonadaceae bacterium]|nr:ROK family protein [Fimbriimonadaceae bacterium]